MLEGGNIDNFSTTGFIKYSLNPYPHGQLLRENARGILSFETHAHTLLLIDSDDVNLEKKFSHWGLSVKLEHKSISVVMKHWKLCMFLHGSQLWLNTYYLYFLRPWIEEKHLQFCESMSIFPSEIFRWVKCQWSRITFAILHLHFYRITHTF